MTAVHEPIAPPRQWMQAVWQRDTWDRPVRHRPGRPHGDLWISRCPDEVWLCDFDAMHVVMVLTPCPRCLELGDSAPAGEQVQQ